MKKEVVQMSVLIKGPNFNYAHNYTIVNVYDESATSDTVSLSNVPQLYMTAVTSQGENGELTQFTGNSAYSDCVAQFGSGTFRAQGQAYMTFLQHLENGGEGIITRICSPNDGQANAIVNVGFKLVEAQKTDLEGNLIYEDANGNETLEADGNAAKMVKKVSVRTAVEYVSSLLSEAAMETLMTSPMPVVDGYTWYHMYGFMATGQGSYGNAYAIRLTSQTNSGYDYPLYQFDVLHTSKSGTVIKEQFDITTSADTVKDSVPVSLEEVIDLYSDSLKVAMNEDVYINIQATIQEALDDNEDLGAEMESLEWILTPKVAADKPWIIYDDSYDNGINLTTGISLKYGTDNWTGGFSWDSVHRDEMVAEFQKAYDGTYTDDIYNTSLFPIDYICDANYPSELKKTIMAFLKKRFDIVFFMDLGKLKTLAQVKTVADALDYNDRNVVVLPYHYKHRESDSSPSTWVTLPYGYSKLFLNHWANVGYHTPMAGPTLATLSISPSNIYPRVTSTQGKSDLAERKLIYLNFKKETAYIDSQVTGQTVDSSLSELHNVFITNRIIKKLLDVIDYYKHKLDTTQEIQRLEDLGNDALDEFRSWCSPVYTVGFASAYEGAKGILTDNLELTFNRTIKKNRLNITILPKVYE
jgi:hypothetical protein